MANQNSRSKDRRISKNRIGLSLRKSNGFLKKEFSVSEKIVNLEKEITNLKSKKTLKSSYDVRLRENQLAELNGRLKMVQGQHSVAQTVYQSYLDKNAGLDGRNSA